jgi:hypothetical protein
MEIPMFQNAIATVGIIAALGVGVSTGPALAQTRPAAPDESSYTLIAETPGVTPTEPSRAEVCAIVTTMPDAEDTDEFLALLMTDRAQVIVDLEATASNMQQYNAEGYGWQNIIDSPGALPPQPDAWLIGALRMACEP